MYYSTCSSGTVVPELLVDLVLDLVHGTGLLNLVL